MGKQKIKSNYNVGDKIKKCKCGCENWITYKLYQKYNGIPSYLYGHHVPRKLTTHIEWSGRRHKPMKVYRKDVIVEGYKNVKERWGGFSTIHKEGKIFYKRRKLNLNNILKKNAVNYVSSGREDNMPYITIHYPNQDKKPLFEPKIIKLQRRIPESIPLQIEYLKNPRRKKVGKGGYNFIFLKQRIDKYSKNNTKWTLQGNYILLDINNNRAKLCGINTQKGWFYFETSEEYNPAFLIKRNRLYEKQNQKAYK